MARVYAVQFDIVWEDKAANHALVERMLDAARPEAGSLIVLPEMFDTGFSLEVDRTAEEVTGSASENWCSKMARQYGAFVQGAAVHLPSAGQKATNCAVVFEPSGELILRYEKIHPFTHGQESDAFRGGAHLTTFTWDGLVVCPLVCYDLRFPELFRIATVDAGAQMFTLGASWPATRHAHWLTLLEARAIENQAYVVGLNRCGRDPNYEFTGGSRIFDPQGKVIASAGDEPVVLTAEVDGEAVETWRREFKVLEDVEREHLGTVTVRSVEVERSATG